LKELLGSLELNRIYQNDCFEGMKLIPDLSCDLAVLDPPYGMSYKSNWSKAFDEIKNDDNLEWVDEFFFELNRVTKTDSHIYCFTSVEYIDVFMREIKKYWKVKNIITVPRTMKGGLGDLHSSFSPQKEFIIFGTKGKRKFEETQILKPSEVYLKDKRKKPKEWIYRLPDDWEWLKVSEHNLKRVHPTQKTVEVTQTMIQLSSKENEVVIDPFMGSGTTAVAASLNNRKWIGFETEKEYIEVANKRLDAIELHNDLNELTK
jgi:site-specific DNA-methyltransferase (adenine-specific)